MPDAKVGQRMRRPPHRRPVRLAAHDDGDGFGGEGQAAILTGRRRLRLLGRGAQGFPGAISEGRTLVRG